MFATTERISLEFVLTTKMKLRKKIFKMNLSRYLNILIFTLLMSCSFKNDDGRLIEENENLVYQNATLEEHNNKLSKENDSLLLILSGQRKKTVDYDFFSVSEEDAIIYIKDYYDFYRRDKTYRNIQIRKIKPNKFIVALDEKNKGGNWLWYTQQYYLTVNIDKTYYFNYGPYINDPEVGKYYLKK